ncbi:zinc finger MYM-type protein 4-like [Polymixia lowei]
MSDPRRCLIPGCQPALKVSLHKIPEEENLRRAWLSFIHKYRTAWFDPDSAFLCTAHFHRRCILNYTQHSMGFAKFVRLKSDAIPSVYSNEQLSIDEGTECEPAGTPLQTGASVELRDPRLLPIESVALCEQGREDNVGSVVVSSITTMNLRETEQEHSERETFRTDSPCPTHSLATPAAEQSGDEKIKQESNEKNKKESNGTGSEVESSPVLGSPLDPATSDNSLSVIEIVSRVSSLSRDEPGSMAECEKAGDAVKPRKEGDNESKEESKEGVIPKEEEEEDCSKERSAGIEDTDLDTSSGNLEETNIYKTEETIDTDIKEDIDKSVENEGNDDSNYDSTGMPVITVVIDRTKEEDEDMSDITKDSNMEPHGSKLKDTTASDSEYEHSKENIASNMEHSSSKLVGTSTDDLDYMMDIETVDQVEQEVDDEQKSTERDCSNSSMPSILNSGKDNNSSVVVNGMKVVQVSTSRLDNEKQITAQESPMASTSDTVKPSFFPPLVKVKDEPMDEEYERGLTSSNPIANIKDEPDTEEEDLKISSVFSVGEKCSSASSAAPTKTEEDSSAQTQTSSPLISPALSVVCSHCKKNLIKGQTAYQRKGSRDLFCSTFCLSSNPPGSNPVSKNCHYCLKLITRPQDIILAPVDTMGTMKAFCNQACLSPFNYKRNSFKKPIEPQSLCSMCNTACFGKQEVVLRGRIHRFCSDKCFAHFRTVNNLTGANCENCGTYCCTPITLKMKDGNKILCKAECLAKFKEKIKTPQPCAMCHTSRLMSEMVDNKDSEGRVDLFCASTCALAYMVQSVSASGALLACDGCGKTTVPAFHLLAMSNTSIRNFCTLPCVLAFQEKSKKNQVNVATTTPVAPTQVQTASSTTTQPDVLIRQVELPCFQCHRLITTKPEVIHVKDKMVFVCSSDCSQTYMRINSVTSACEQCQLVKVINSVQKINQKNCSFCSDVCKRQYNLNLSQKGGRIYRCCAYCSSLSMALVTRCFGNKALDFCSVECKAKYSMIFNQFAKCDTCNHQKKLLQTLPILGKVKHFCDLQCLLQFCRNEALIQGQIVPKVASSSGPSGRTEATPVIANVVSMASAPTGQQHAVSNTILLGAVPNTQTKTLGHASTQTDVVKTPPPPPPRVLKNKALLCRPMVQNKGVTCKTQTVDTGSQTDDNFPKVIVLPVPVPVFVPVPMNMYSQYTPKPMSLPIPLPVPMFLPVTLDSAEAIVEAIQEIKEKIPSNPFKADLIFMAEMLAEQDGKNEKEEQKEKQKERVVEKQRDRPEAQAPDDHVSNSDDLDTDDLASFLSNWENPSPGTSLKSPDQPHAHEKLHPILDISAGMPSEPYSELSPPAPPPLDLEADFPIETLEKMSQLREQAQRTPSPPPASTRRRQAHRKARKKGHKSRRLAEAEVSTTAVSLKGSSNKSVFREPPKLDSKYGIDAWKRWIQWREKQPNLEKPRFGSRPMELKEDVLRCTTAELSYGLCRFIAEVKRPTGESYSPDSLFYLCLGIQQHLVENGHLENIFTDVFYSKFSMEITKILKDFKPSITASGYVHSRVEEDYLWDCKQLGASSPFILLNTLLFLCSKNFGFTTVQQHRQLSFSNIIHCTKTNLDNTKTNFLRFYIPLSSRNPETDADGVPAKKQRKEVILEMMENSENPLRCPVRLYEFYLSKCSESVKQRTNMFYLHPERSCIPNSPMWFSSTPLDNNTMGAMLTRILTVRELHLQPGKEGGGRGERAPDNPPFLPDDEEEEEDSG